MISDFFLLTFYFLLFTFHSLRVPDISEGDHQILLEALRASARQRRPRDHGCQLVVTLPEEIHQREGAETLPGRPGGGRKGRRVIPRADFLADVAAEKVIAYRFTELIRDVASLFDGEI